jgi:Flp pilus assembly protein TadG
MMHGLASACRRFAVSTRAVAAVEFAMILPVLMILFLSSFDAANCIAVYLKVRAATFSLAAITNQYGIGGNTPNPSIATTDMTTITGATASMLAPYSSIPTVVTVSQIDATTATQAVVSWSYSVNGTALTTGAPFTGLPAQMAANSCNGTYPCYFILASVSYTYTPAFGSFLTGPISLSDSLYVTPRVSQCVIYNNAPSSCASGP